MKRTLAASITVLAAFLLALNGPAIAQTSYSWDHDPATPGDWFEPTNWNPDGLPTTSDAYVVNGGTVQITSGNAVSSSFKIGYGTNVSGFAVQTGGSYSGSGITVGANTFSYDYARGEYELTDGLVTVDYLTILTGGDGTASSRFWQKGGTVHVNQSLWMGVGLYQFDGGSLSVGTITNGRFVQNGGDATVSGAVSKTIIELNGGTLSFASLDIYYDPGALVQNGGTCNVTGELYGGNISLNAGNLFSNSCVSGTFKQTGGIHTVGNLLAHSYYQLGGTGQLLAVNESMENSDLYGGLITQTGGSNTVTGVLDISAVQSGGRYEWFGGEIFAHELKLNSKSTLSMGFNFDVADIQSGSLMHLPTAPDISPMTLEISNSATASHSTADMQVQVLRVGSWTGEGTYNLSGMGVLRTFTQYIGGGGLGTFNHSGGTNLVSGNLYIGQQSGSHPIYAGVYNLSGTGVIQTPNEYVGYDTGTLSQTGGTNSITSALYIGWNYESPLEGRYELSGDGVLSALTEYLGYRGQGTFVQIGGSNTVGDTLYLGSQKGSNWSSKGIYQMSGTGVLSAPKITVGVAGRGEFKQSGGSVGAKYLSIGSNGEYDFTGGALEISRRFDSKGKLDCGGQVVTFGAPVSGFVDISSGVFTNMSQASFSGGPESLLIYDGALPPASVFASVNTSGFMHQKGTTLNIPSGRTVTGWGDITGHVDCQGTLSNGGDGVVNVKGGIFVSPTGQANLAGTVTVNNLISGMNGGALSASTITVGEASPGKFAQTGGTCSLTGNMYVGKAAGIQGTYELSDSGSLNALDVHLGESGNGALNQSGGSATITGNLYLGYAAGSRGDYSLSGGSLSLTGSSSPNNTLWLGYNAPGGFVQTGGTCTTKALEIGVAQGLSTYELTGTGQLSATSEFIGDAGFGKISTGLITQTGGSHTAIGTTLGPKAGSTGKYSMSGGSYVGNLVVGSLGTGIFEVTNAGASITVTNTLRFGTDGRLNAVPGTVIHMKGATFDNKNNDPTDLAGLANLKLIYDGQTGANDPFEVAGKDLGRDMDGFVSNFALGAMELDDKAVVQLADTFDNAHRNGVGGSAESMYLSSLTMLPGSTLDLNGLHLYVSDLDYQGGAILNGTLISLIPGDADNNFKIDGADLALWQQNYDPSGVHSATNAFAMGDWNNDGKIDGADLALWQQNYNPSGGLPQQTPEPGTLLLLGTGLLSLGALARRRLMT